MTRFIAYRGAKLKSAKRTKAAHAGLIYDPPSELMNSAIDIAVTHT